MLAAGPPFPDPVGDQLVYDDADVLLPATRTHLESMTDSIRSSQGLDLVVYTQRRDGGTPTLAAAELAADALRPPVGRGHGPRRRPRVRMASWAMSGVAVGPEHGPLRRRRRPGRDPHARSPTGSVGDDLDTALIVGVSDVLFEVWGAVEPEGEEGGIPGNPAIDRRPAVPRPHRRPGGLRLRRHPLDRGHPRGRGDHRRHRGADRAPRSSSTPSSSTTASRPRRPSGAPAPSSTSGASAGPASMTGWPSSSTSIRRWSTARSSCTPRPASRPRS